MRRVVQDVRDWLVNWGVGILAGVLIYLAIVFVGLVTVDAVTTHVENVQKIADSLD